MEDYLVGFEPALISHYHFIVLTRLFLRDGDMALDYGASEAGQLSNVWTRGKR